jgi:hypothetical protein
MSSTSTTIDYSNRPKSLYTGAGLGLKRDTKPVFNPKGSAKAVLKKILETDFTQ